MKQIKQIRKDEAARIIENYLIGYNIELKNRTHIGRINLDVFDTAIYGENVENRFWINLVSWEWINYRNSKYLTQKGVDALKRIRKEKVN